MAHLLIIENWVEGTGRLFPATIRRLGHTYTFVTRNKDHYVDKKSPQMHPIFEYAENILTLETNDIDALIEQLRAQHRLLHFDGVSTICDYYVDTVAQVAQALDLPQAFSSNVVLERRKHLVRQALQRAGIQNPKFAVTSDWTETVAAADRIGYPLVLKPCDLASSAFVKLIDSEAQLREGFTELQAFTHNFRGQARDALWLLEEFMQGDEVSVEAVTFQGETTIVGITDKSLTGFPYFIEDGHMFPARLEAGLAEAVTTYVTQALEAVGHDHGISHTEVKLTPAGPRLVEINPRPGGNFIAELIQLVTGIDLLETHVNLALNRQPALDGLEHCRGSAAVKFLVPPAAGVLKALEGGEKLQQNPNLVRWRLAAVSDMKIAAPIDNACYLGHVISRDSEGDQARCFAEQALSELRLLYSEAADQSPPKGVHR
ncbi:ATP-grasp domain-containing protein [Exilibacterium tricleocarpae]|uniref:ATP-grasp domain-containing protein n=1 Tax=Exilibacterium tricleocarpae TaxID=2591008 RepID=A0A545T027_9GAMM|nr:ATP-grasp domain-containing protein [Exilibacterium tricleocarpae]TQV70573.1 ATP-grasp domain-containing protein [Exilibacterium tricleocarpae]